MMEFGDKLKLLVHSFVEFYEFYETNDGNLDRTYVTDYNQTPRPDVTCAHNIGNYTCVVLSPFVCAFLFLLVQLL